MLLLARSGDAAAGGSCRARPVLVLLAPWPDANVLLVPAHPTSFHRSPTGFSTASIAQGRALYAQHCVACHGADGRGGPLAAAQPVWPPNLAGPLLWRRADGEVLWRILHGTQDRQGHATMPAFNDSRMPATPGS